MVAQFIDVYFTWMICSSWIDTNKKTEKVLVFVYRPQFFQVLVPNHTIEKKQNVLECVWPFWLKELRKYGLSFILFRWLRILSGKLIHFCVGNKICIKIQNAHIGQKINLIKSVIINFQAVSLVLCSYLWLYVLWCHPIRRQEAASHQRCSVKKMLVIILQNSQKNICIRLVFSKIAS